MLVSILKFVHPVASHWVFSIEAERHWQDGWVEGKVTCVSALTDLSHDSVKDNTGPLPNPEQSHVFSSLGRSFLDHCRRTFSSRGRTVIPQIFSPPVFLGLFWAGSVTPFLGSSEWVV